MKYSGFFPLMLVLNAGVRYKLQQGVLDLHRNSVPPAQRKSIFVMSQNSRSPTCPLFKTQSEVVYNRRMKTKKSSSYCAM